MPYPQHLPSRHITTQFVAVRQVQRHRCCHSPPCSPGTSALASPCYGPNRPNHLPSGQSPPVPRHHNAWQIAGRRCRQTEQASHQDRHWCFDTAQMIRAVDQCSGLLGVADTAFGQQDVPGIIIITPDDHKHTTPQPRLHTATEGSVPNQ